MSQTTVKLTPAKDTVFVYEGKAPEIKDPRRNLFTGTIDTPARWLEKRNEEEAYRCNVMVDRENMTVTLTINEDSPFCDIINGQITMHPIFKKFGINKGEYCHPIELAQLFKMNRTHFENQSKAMALVTELQNFKAKVDKEIERSENNRGDRRTLQAQVVSSNIPEKFNLLIPIFKGQPKQLIEVEIYINPSDLTCTLVSPEANDIAEAYVDEAIDAVIERIATAYPEIAIIEI